MSEHHLRGIIGGEVLPETRLREADAGKISLDRMLIFLPDTHEIHSSVWTTACSNAQMRDRCFLSEDTFYGTLRYNGGSFMAQGFQGLRGSGFPMNDPSEKTKHALSLALLLW